MDCLSGLKRIKLRRKVELLEVVCGCETNSKYEICDDIGRPLLLAKEDTGSCQRIFCESERAFLIRVMSLPHLDNHEIELMRFTRSFRCSCCHFCNCSSCCRDCVTVESPPGTVVGSVHQESSLCSVSYSVRDASNSAVLHLSGPRYCNYACPTTVHTVTLLSADRTQAVGMLRKKWLGSIKDLAASADIDVDAIEVEVPADMAVAAKATVVAAALLIGIVFFEDEGVCECS